MRWPLWVLVPLGGVWVGYVAGVVVSPTVAPVEEGEPLAVANESLLLRVLPFFNLAVCMAVGGIIEWAWCKMANAYFCAGCDAEHREGQQPDMGAVKEGKYPGRCSAQYRQVEGSGLWRFCHARFDVMGGPNPIGDARLCDPCFDRQVLARARGFAGAQLQASPRDRTVRDAVKEAWRQLRGSS